MLREFNFEEELVVDRGQQRIAGGDHERNALDGSQTPPPVVEVDKNRHRLSELPVFNGQVNPSRFTFWKFWLTTYLI